MPKARYESYIILTSPRSGSTLLCKLLEATGKSGIPDSYFHNPSLSGWLKSHELCSDDFASDRDALSEIINSARKRGTGDTGIFGLRLQRGSFDFFMQQITMRQPGCKSDVERIQAEFGNTLFIYLARQSKLEQAISRVKAVQTGLWHKAADGTEMERQSDPKEPYYDAEAISRNLAELTALDEAWLNWFDQQRLLPLKLSYDELSHNPAAVLARVLRELGLDETMAHAINPPVAKLADATNRIWAEYYSAQMESSR